MDFKKAQKQVSDCRKVAEDLLPLITETPRLRMGAFASCMEVRVLYRFSVLTTAYCYFKDDTQRLFWTDEIWKALKRFWLPCSALGLYSFSVSRRDTPTTG